MIPDVSPNPSLEVKNGDFLITRSNTEKLVGEVCVVECARDKLMLCDLVYRLTLDSPRANKRFYNYYFCSRPGRYEIVRDARGTSNTMVKISQERIKEWTVPLPSIFEQNTIVGFLDRETVRIDVLIAKKERQIALLREKRTALISRAVTKGLDPSAPMKDSGIAWISDAPAHWDIGPLHSRYHVQLGKMLDGAQITGEHLAPYLRNVDVQWDSVNVSALPEMDFSAEDRQRFSLRNGDLLVCEGGEVGRTAIWNGQLGECYYQKALHRVRPIRDDASRFMYYCMVAAASMGVFEEGSDVSTIGHLTAVKLRKHRFPFPPVSEQIEIANHLDRETQELDTLISTVRDSNDLLKEYRTALISAAVTGKIDVRSEVPA